ncbi:atherin-like [Ochotona princeps]|uniref:atherin-like n=1 Tax=Ochotona princeps TaxID=9978 RepID=UPI00271521B1|nr:atherin-like [Ochotona princeps]
MNAGPSPSTEPASQPASQPPPDGQRGASPGGAPRLTGGATGTRVARARAGGTAALPLERAAREAREGPGRRRRRVRPAPAEPVPPRVGSGSPEARYARGRRRCLIFLRRETCSAPRPARTGHAPRAQATPPSARRGHAPTRPRAASQILPPRGPPPNPAPRTPSPRRPATLPRAHRRSPTPATPPPKKA